LTSSFFFDSLFFVRIKSDTKVYQIWYVRKILKPLVLLVF